MASKPTDAIPHLVAVDASALPQTPEAVALLKPDKRVAVSHGCEERCAVPSRTEDVTLGRFVEKLRGDPKAGYLTVPFGRFGLPVVVRAHAPFLTSWVQETAFLWVGGAAATTGLHSDDEDNVHRRTEASTCCSRLHQGGTSTRTRAMTTARSAAGRRVSVRGGEGAAVSAVRGCASPLSFVLTAGDALFIPHDWFP